MASSECPVTVNPQLGDHLSASSEGVIELSDGNKEQDRSSYEEDENDDRRARPERERDSRVVVGGEMLMLRQRSRRGFHELPLSLQSLQDLPRPQELNSLPLSQSLQSIQDQQTIKDAVKQQWKYSNCIGVIFGISLTYFSIDIWRHGWIGVLEVQLPLLIVSSFLAVLFYLLFREIKNEQQLSAGNSERAGDAAKRSPIKMFLFILSICLVLAIYIFISLNSIFKWKSAGR